VASTVDLTDLRVHVGPLIAPGGGTAAIPNAIRVRYPAYVPDERVGSGRLADPLLEVDRVDVAAGEVQPVWFTLFVPAEAAPGTYRSRIVIRAEEMRSVTYALTVEVSEVTLPPPAERNYHLNLWFQPDTIADQLGLELWSEEHFEAMEPYLQDLAEHGQRVVNTAIAQDPWRVLWPDGGWRSQTYVPYNSLVDWYYDGDEWSFDFDLWDRVVEQALDSGIGPYIHAFGLLGFRNNFLVYTDTRTGEVVDRQVTVGGADWVDAWSAFLAAFEDHVRDRGWLDVTYMAFDERPASQMQQALALGHEFAPELTGKGFAGAGSANTDPFTFDLSLNYSSVNSWPQAVIDRRRDEGKLTTFYTWGQPFHPNTRTDSPPIGARALSWRAAKSRLDGYLRWAYNSWPEDPYTASFRYVSGDEYLVYPGQDGPVSKIGWELFRDGQEDYALLDQLATRGGAEHPVRLAALDSVNPGGAPGPTTYDALLSARAMVVEALENLPNG
jgi:sialidase-1